MPTLTTAQRINAQELADVRRFFETLSHAETFKYCLNLNRRYYPSAPVLAASTIVVCLDTEGWDASSIVMKELGINTFDSRDLAQLSSPGPWGENIMKHIYFYFARVQRHAHLMNRNYSAGDPETNRFGQMRFLNDHEITDCLKETFEWPLGNSADGTVCPVVLLGHALENDVDKIEKLLGFNLMARGNLVKQIDTQIIARDVGHWNHPVNQIGLQRLVNELGFEYRDSHTACNDAAMTTIAAIQLVLDKTHKGITQPKSLQMIIDQTEIDSQKHFWNYGSPKFCFRCGARDHTRENSIKGGACRVRVHCDHCAIKRPESQYGHRSEVCVMKAFETSNSSRPNPKRRHGRMINMPQADVSVQQSNVPSTIRPIQEVSNANSGLVTYMSELPVVSQSLTSPTTVSPVPVWNLAPTRSWANVARLPPSGVTPVQPTRNIFIARHVNCRKEQSTNKVVLSEKKK